MPRRKRSSSEEEEDDDDEEEEDEEEEEEMEEDDEEEEDVESSVPEESEEEEENKSDTSDSEPQHKQQQQHRTVVHDEDSCDELGVSQTSAPCSLPTRTPHKHPLRSTRSSGSDSEIVALDTSEKGADSGCSAAPADDSPPRTPTGNAPSSDSELDVSSLTASNDDTAAPGPPAPPPAEGDSGSDRSGPQTKRQRCDKSPGPHPHCPTPGCNSFGHLTGKYECHFSTWGCPLYHNMTAEECKRRALDRENRAEEWMTSQWRDESRHTTRHAVPTEKQLRYREKISEFRKNRNVGPTEDQKRLYDEHRQMHGTKREPLLQGLTSDFDLELFRQAQARASEDMERIYSLGAGVLAESTRAIHTIVFGRYELDTWYHSPYPEEYTRLGKLYICEFCLKFMKSSTILRRHTAKCVWKHPPGDEIYRKGSISVFEVDGKRNKTYCQNLCLLAKLFLDHKTLYYDVEPFLFYVMTEDDSSGCHLVGYFSKEKNSFLNYNVSCILTMPQFMKQGYGKMLIEFSYLLSKVEDKVGSPERPLSDLGLISYRSYWKSVLLRYLHNYQGKEISIKEMSQETAVNPADIVSTLQYLQMLKYWKGKHLVLKRQDIIDEWLEKEAKKQASDKIIDASCLKWSPLKDS
uniref:histone acetyltransferase KAT7-like isoform X2 n=1 Tax=Myxine glutinosa TaxID=7769 RepID=UPI00358E6E40